MLQCNIMACKELLNSCFLRDVGPKYRVRKERSYRPPTNRTYPSYDGKTRIPVLSSITIDPDGHVVELKDLLMDPEDM